MKKWLRRILIVVFVLLMVSQLPLFAAMAVMGVYSTQNVEEDEERLASVGLKRVEVTLPGGLSTFMKGDYFPFVMTFCDNGFGYFYGDRAYNLTILYNFGAFEPLKLHSSLFDEDSLYYNSFYGAYLVTDTRSADKVRPYAFNSDGSVDIDAIPKVPEYDFSRLVLRDFGLGLGDFVWDWSVTGEENGIALAGLDGWTRLDADITVSGSKHQLKEFVSSYLQYGFPLWPIEGEEFESVSMKGTVFCRYFPEEQTSVFLYALCCDEGTLQSTIENYLLKANVK